MTLVESLNKELGQLRFVRECLKCHNRNVSDYDDKIQMLEKILIEGGEDVPKFKAKSE